MIYLRSAFSSQFPHSGGAAAAVATAGCGIQT